MTCPTSSWRDIGGAYAVSSGTLKLGTQYSFAAYATNSVGTSYTSACTLTTLGVGNTNDSGPARCGRPC